MHLLRLVTPSVLGLLLLVGCSKHRGISDSALESQASVDNDSAGPAGGAIGARNSGAGAVGAPGQAGDAATGLFGRWAGAAAGFGWGGAQPGRAGGQEAGSPATMGNGGAGDHDGGSAAGTGVQVATAGGAQEPAAGSSGGAAGDSGTTAGRAGDDAAEGGAGVAGVAEGAAGGSEAAAGVGGAEAAGSEGAAGAGGAEAAGSDGEAGAGGAEAAGSGVDLTTKLTELTTEAQADYVCGLSGAQIENLDWQGYATGACSLQGLMAAAGTCETVRDACLDAGDDGTPCTLETLPKCDITVQAYVDCTAAAVRAIVDRNKAITCTSTLADVPPVPTPDVCAAPFTACPQLGPAQ